MAVELVDDFHPSFNSSIPLPDLQCIDTTVGRHVLNAVCFTYALFTGPLSVFVLCLGFQRLKQRCSASSSAIMTHSDFFTYNMAFVELVGVFAYVCLYCTSYTGLPYVSSVSTSVVNFIWPAQTIFPIFVCVDRYLAVVHPITYRSLRQGAGVRIRNISTAFIWLCCTSWLLLLIVVNVPYYYRRVTGTFVLILALSVMVFCSLSVLRILIRPGPGTAGSRVQVGQPKQRAAYTVLIIMAVLWLKFGGNVIVLLIRFSTSLSAKCVGEVFVFVSFVPTSVILPLLFLHRAGKLPTCKHSSGTP